MESRKIRQYTYLFLGILILAFIGINLFAANPEKNISQSPVNQKFTYKIGDVVKDFSLKNIDGKMISLASNNKAEGYILMFTCNHCPYANAYENRIADLNKKYALLGYPVLAINPNSSADNEEDSYEENIKMAASVLNVAKS